MDPSDIQQLRLRLGWKQADLARRLCVSSKTVSYWETARARPSREHMLALMALAGDSPLRTMALPPDLNELDHGLALVALMIAEGLETDIPVLDADGNVSLVHVDEKLVEMGELLTEQLRALSEYLETPNMFILRLQRVRDMLTRIVRHLWSTMSAGRDDAQERLAPFLLDMRQVHEGTLKQRLAALGLVEGMSPQPSARSPIEQPDEAKIHSSATALLRRLVELVTQGRPTVISYSWAYERLFGYRPDYWQTRVHAQAVIDAAIAVPRVPLPGLGQVGLDSFIVRVTDGMPGRRHWSYYTGVYDEDQWRAILGRADRLHRSQQSL